MARTRSLWLALLLLTLTPGCDFLQDEPDPVAPTAPVVTVPRFAEAPFVVPLNEPFTLTALVNQPDGSPATGYEFNWGGWQPGGPEVRSEVGHPAPGVETLTLTFLREGRYDISAIVTTVNEAGAAVVYVRPETVIAWGGTTRELLPFQQEVALRVGEARPSAVLPHAQRTPAEPNVRVPGHQPVTYAIEHPTIARVDDAGVVHGLAPGTTRLTFRTGDVTASIPVKVSAGDLGPPPDGITPYDGLAAPAVRSDYGAKLRAGKVSPEDQLALDSRGWPVSVLTAGANLVAPKLSTTLYTVLLGAWTGSGVGIERVNQPWEEAHHPRLAIDSRDVSYVAYVSRSFNDVVVADRPAGGAPGSWRYRRLPMDLSLAAEGGLRPRQYVGHDLDGRVTLLPRAGGGVWVAYWMVDDFRTQNPAHHVTKYLETPGPCADVLKLAEVTDTQVKTWEVSVEWYRVADGQDCGRSTGTTRHDDRAPHLLPPAPGTSLPRLLSTLQDNVVLFEPTGDTWSSRELARPGPGASGYVPPNFVTLARPESPEGKTVLLSHSALQGALPADLSFNALPGQAALPYLSYEGGDSSRQTLRFAFQSAGRLFSGSGFVGPLVVQTGFGGILREDPSGTWSPRPYNGQEGENFPIRGRAHRGTRLHLLAESSIATPLLLSRALPQADPLPTDAESRGSRLGATPSTPPVSTSPLVLADGSRYLLTDFRDALAPGGVLRSDGPGQPFVTRSARPSSAPLSLARRLHVSRDGVFFFTEPAGTPRLLELHRSSDQGRAFSRVSALPVTAPLEAGLVHPEGPVFLMLFDSARPLNFQLGFSPDATSATPPVLRAGFSSADEGKLLVIHGVLLSTPTRVWLVLDTLLNDGTSSKARVLLREYDLAGALVSERTVDPQLAPGHYLRPPGAALSGDGGLLWMTATETRRFDLATGNLAKAALTPKNAQETVLAPVRLADGRWLLPVTDAPSLHVHRAGYRLSTNGLDWGDFHALRPGGGDAQSVLGVAAEPDGAALFVLQDSGLMMSADGVVSAQSLVQRVVP